MKTYKTIVYVTRDIERALGMEPGIAIAGPLAGIEYFIITNRSHYAELISAKYPGYVELVDRPKDSEPLDTFELLNDPIVRKNISSKKGAGILVFKNTSRIEKLARENNWNVLNPSAQLAEKIEEKISQVKWLDKLTTYLPPHEITVTKNVSLKKDVKGKVKPLVLQWAHGHTGKSTLIVTDEKQLEKLKTKFPNREVRVSEYIKGPTFTVNVVAGTKKGEIKIGNISYQITGALPFTDNPLTTIGNDWSLTHSILAEKHTKKIEEIAQEIGEKARNDGWLGLFGIDVIYDEERDEIKLIEINARQPASTSYESLLQLRGRVLGVSGDTIFEAHICALMNKKIDEIIPINDGAQIIQRVTPLILKSVKLPDIIALESASNICIQYDNTKIGSDLLRIQSIRGIMETHNKFNKRGKEIVDIITK